VSEQSHSLVEVRDAIRHLEGRMDRRIDALEDKVSRQFIWIIGVQVTTFVALAGAMISRG